jgi:hypothetical protein
MEHQEILCSETYNYALPKITAGRGVVSDLTNRAMTNRETDMELIFNADVFGHRGEKDVHKKKVKDICALIDMDSPNRLLLIDESSPKFEPQHLINMFCSYNPPEKKKEKFSGNSRIYTTKFEFFRNFNQQSVKILLEQRDCWLNYWKIKFDIQELFEELQSCGDFSLEDVQDQLLISFFYVNMITSIVVDKSDPEWEKKQENNRCLIQDFAKKFQKNLSEIFLNITNQKWYYSQVQNIPSRKWRITWILIKDWLEDVKRYSIIHKMLCRKVPHIELFDYIFGYSIVSMNKKVSEFTLST